MATFVIHYDEFETQLKVKSLDNELEFSLHELIYPMPLGTEIVYLENKEESWTIILWAAKHTKE
jgi:hypothetical protein